MDSKITRPPIDGGTILITGASAGIGRALTLQLAPRAQTLVLVARGKESLQSLQSHLVSRYARLSVHIEPCDLSDTRAVNVLVRNVQRAAGHVDILINNAGVGAYSLFDQASWYQINQALRMNVLAVCALSYRYVPAMVARGRGGILNIGAGAEFQWLPAGAVSVGTNQFVDGFTNALRADLAGTGVVVTQVMPGPIGAVFRPGACNPDTHTLLTRLIRISAGQCAREAIRGFESTRPLVLPGIAYRMLIHLSRLTPPFVQRRAREAAAIQQRRSQYS
jgi:short-subunit dehydrogenase